MVEYRMAPNKPVEGPGKAGTNGAGRLRSIPSVDRVMSHPLLEDARARLPHGVIAAAARAEVESVRQGLVTGRPDGAGLEEIAERAARRAFGMAAPSLRPVIN